MYNKRCKQHEFLNYFPKHRNYGLQYGSTSGWFKSFKFTFLGGLGIIKGKENKDVCKVNFKGHSFCLYTIALQISKAGIKSRDLWIFDILFITVKHLFLFFPLSLQIKTTGEKMWNHLHLWYFETYGGFDDNSIQLTLFHSLLC